MSMDGQSLDINNLAQRVKQGLSRKQVALGKDNFTRYCVSKRLGLVWVTEDLAPHAIKKMRDQCQKHDIPFLVKGWSEDIDAITNLHNTKVYLLKKNFSGLNYLLKVIESEAEGEA